MTLRPEHQFLGAGGTVPRCLVIVPALNESATVGKLVGRLHQALPSFDILVIDDGSTDDTAEVARARGAKVIRLPFNSGIGVAMQAGYQYAAENQYHIAVQVDGDGQHRPSEVLTLIRHLHETGSGLVVGSRFLGGARHYRQTLSRRIGARVLRATIGLLTGQRITDCTSGFRAASRSVILAFAKWYPEDYPEPEVILLLHRAGFRVTEVPVKMRQRRAGRSSIDLMGGLFYVVKGVVCLVLDMVRDPWGDARSARGKLDPGFDAALSSGRVEAGVGRTSQENKHERDSEPHPVDVRWRPAASGTTPTPPV